MERHFIVMSSSYSLGTRIALDFIISDSVDFTGKKGICKRIIDECGDDVSISTHYIETDSKAWKSVQKLDPYFEDVKLISNEEDFISLIKKDRDLKGIDVAKYIISLISCTHLKLEKLCYLCYADYLQKYGERLFEDKIFAYKYGPVVKSVYDKYKNYYKYTISENNDVKSINVSEEFQMPARSRIMFAKDGAKKLSSIDKTLKKYGELSAGMLVEITHRNNTPWTMSGKGMTKNEVIIDSVIAKYHINEEPD